MVEAPRRSDAPTAESVRAYRLPRGVLGTIAVAAAACAVGVCLSETPTAVYSFCGTCRGGGRASLHGEAAWAIVGSWAAALAARFVAHGEIRAARSAAFVASVMWLVSVGFVWGWW